MESLKESILRNIKQDDNSILETWKEWVEKINWYFIERYVGIKNINIMYGRDYEITKGVLNYKQGIEGGETWLELSSKDMRMRITQPPPPKGLKLGRMWKSSNSADKSGFKISLWDLDIEKLEDIIDYNYEGSLHIYSCKKLDHIDLTKYKGVKIIDISGCKLKYVKLHDHMQRVSISDDVERVYGCEKADDFYINRIHQKTPGSIEFPREIHKLSIANSNLKDYENFPEYVRWFETYKSSVNGGNITEKRLAKVTKFDHYIFKK